MFETVLLIGAVIAILIVAVAKAIQPHVLKSVNQAGNTIDTSSNQWSSWVTTPVNYQTGQP